MIDRDLDRLELVLELIAHIRRRISATSWEKFQTDQDEIDLLAFRILHIGETTNRLSEELKQRHPDIPWRAIYNMRNVISHDYDGMIPQLLWNVAVKQLDLLAEICERELKDKQK